MIKDMQYWSVLGGTGLEQGCTGCKCDMLSEKIWLTWSRASNYWIFKEGKIDDGKTDKQTDRQTDRVSSCRLDPFCGRGRVKWSFCNKNISLNWTFVVTLTILLKSKQLLTWFSSWGGEKLADLCSWGPPCWLLHWDRDNQNDEDDYQSHWWWCLSSLLMMMFVIIVDDGA